MEIDQDRATAADQERRAAVVGVSAAPTLALLTLLVGAVEGGLLPGACEGLGCLFGAIYLGATGVVLVVWLVTWPAVRAARRRWPEVGWRVWLLRVLAAASWAPVVWLVALALG